MPDFDTEKPPRVFHGVHPAGPHSLDLDFSENPEARDPFGKWLESGAAWADFGTWADAQPMQELADAVHDLMCGQTSKQGGCRQYKAGSPHHDFFQLRAEALTDVLGPLTGSARIIEVVKAVIGEVV
jgi:hypothetical protein